MSRYEDPVPQYLDGNGDPLINGKLFFTKSGTNTPLSTFKDKDETIPNTVQDGIPLDAAARVPNIFFTGLAKVVLLADDLSTGETGKQIFERDPVGDQNETGDFALWDTSIGYDQNDIVKGSNGKFYLSLSDENQANDPTLTAGANEFWVEIRFLGVFNTKVPYASGDIVQTTDGNLWKSLIASNLNNNPSTDDGKKWVPAFNDLPKNISTATNLVKGKKYVSTATASHVVPAASGGAPIEITWLDGTIMTLTSASNMSVTTSIKTTDTTWVFESFIQILTLVDTGTEWEIK